METAEWLQDWGRNGYAIARAAFLPEQVSALRESLSDLPAEDSSRRRGSVYAVRNALEIPVVRAVTADSALRELARAALGADAFAVRALLFDKTPEANWPVPWHQDLSVAVRERREVDGWGPWSEKAGVPHVQPPAVVLERMATTRLHLDDCGPENGPLLALPGTHRLGRLTAEQIASETRGQEAVLCTASAGDVLLMRPLLLHASGKAIAPGHRRVLHIEWATDDLPNGLTWFETV